MSSSIYCIRYWRLFLFIFFKNILLKYISLWNQFYCKLTPIQYFLFFSLVSNSLTNYGRRHFKPLTNCFVGHPVAENKQTNKHAINHHTVVVRIEPPSKIIANTIINNCLQVWPTDGVKTKSPPNFTLTAK